MSATKKDLIESARVVGLYVATHSPGDRITRYRFFDKPAYEGGDTADYHGGRELGSCAGLRDAHNWLLGYRTLYAKLLNEGVIKLKSVKEELAATKI